MSRQEFIDSLFNVLETVKQCDVIEKSTFNNTFELVVKNLLLRNGFLDYKCDYNKHKIGKYFKYHPNGTQRAPDFEILLCVDGIVQVKIPIEVKSSKSKRIFLNDGWFKPEYIYIISCIPSKKGRRVIIAMGNDIASREETLFRNNIVDTPLNTFNKQIKSSKPDHFSYEPNLRKADKYAFKDDAKWTDQYIREIFDYVKMYIFFIH